MKKKVVKKINVNTTTVKIHSTYKKLLLFRNKFMFKLYCFLFYIFKIRKTV